MAQTPARTPISVGKYFLDRGKVSEAQLQLALRHREEFGLKLGQSLVELGFVTEADMVEALRHQERFPCVHLTRGIVETRVATQVGEETSRRLRALALDQFAGFTTVALEDPSHEAALRELAEKLGTRIFPVYSEPSTILRLIDKVFGARGGNAPAPALPVSMPATTQAAAPSPLAASAPNAPPPDERSVVDRLRHFLQQAFEQGVSDIHFETRGRGLLVRFRCDGLLREHCRLPASWCEPALACLRALAKLEKLESPRPQRGKIDFAFRKQAYEVLLATTPATHGECAVLHIQRPREPLSLEALGLPEAHLGELRSALAATSGLWLVTGPAGSGRTTTSLALLEHFGENASKTVAWRRDLMGEVDGVLAVELGTAPMEPAEVIRMLIDQDPDVFFFGAIETQTAAQELFAAALAGRGVLTSLRAGSARAALAQLFAFGLEPYLLAQVLRGIVAQRLVRRLCQSCKAPVVPDEALRERLALPLDSCVTHEGEGCEACHGTGYRGTTRLFEVWTVTPDLRRELELGGDSRALVRAAEAGRATSLRAHGLELARAGETTLLEILAATTGG